MKQKALSHATEKSESWATAQVDPGTRVMSLGTRLLPSLSCQLCAGFIPSQASPAPRQEWLPVTPCLHAPWNPRSFSSHCFAHLVFGSFWITVLLFPTPALIFISALCCNPSGPQIESGVFFALTCFKLNKGDINDHISSVQEKFPYSVTMFSQCREKFMFSHNIIWSGNEGRWADFEEVKE